MNVFKFNTLLFWDKTGHPLQGRLLQNKTPLPVPYPKSTVLNISTCGGKVRKSRTHKYNTAYRSTTEHTQVQYSTHKHNRAHTSTIKHT